MGPTQPSSFLARNEFLIRRLHSLSGLIPVGAYMCIHLLTNASILDGPGTFQNAVFNIHKLGVLLPIVEWTLIFIPILFHGVLGIVIIRGGLPNSGMYTYASNFRYTLQRATGIIAFIFIMLHVFHLHGWFHAETWIESVAKPLGGYQFRAYNAASTAAAALKNPVIIAGYVVGILCCVFHLANGIWTMGITWGVWVTPAAQRQANVVCSTFGVLLAVVGLAAIVGFSTQDVDAAKETERRMYELQTEAGIIKADEHKRSQDDNRESRSVESTVQNTLGKEMKR